MRTSEERARDVLERHRAYQRRQERRQSAIATGTLCAVLILSLCVGLLPQLRRSQQPSHDAATYADIFEKVNHAIDDVYWLYDRGSDDTGTIPELSIDVSLDGLGGTGDKGDPGASTGTVNTITLSQTNLQVIGVDEADIVKTDGRYLYVVSGSRIVIVDPNDGKPQLLSEVTPDTSAATGWSVSGLYLCGDRLVVMHYEFIDRRPVTVTDIYDIRQPSSPTFVERFEQDGTEISSRVVGDVLYTVTSYALCQRPSADDPATFVPRVGCGEEQSLVAVPDIYICEESAQYIVVTGVRVSGDAERLSEKAVMTNGHAVYANTRHLYVAGNRYGSRKTPLIKFALNDGKLEQTAQVTLDGELLNQFSMDEHNGYLRVVLTEYTDNTTTNSLLVLDSELNTVGSLTGLAADERVYSVRFTGDVGYFVTFRQVDPLFTVDLSDPTKPVVKSQLKIPGFSQYLHPYGDGKLLGIGMNADAEGRTDYMKLSMFDTSDPTAVSEADVLILDQRYSEVLGNHKAALIDVGRNLIGFATGDNTYHIYGYGKDGFVLKARVAALGGHGIRGVYIGEYLYVVSGNGMLTYRLDDFSSVGALSIVKTK